MAWRLAGSLITFRDQLNAAFSHRSKRSDGYIGDAAHQAQGSASDHNPWVRDGAGVGVVTAGDFTHDPGAGVDIDRISDELQASRDPRIKYVIANAYIMSGNGGPSPWVWRRYSGSNPHTSHVHISVHSNLALADDTRPWQIPSFGMEQDMQQDERDALFAVKNQLSGSFEDGQFPGWPSFVNDSKATPVDYLRIIDRSTSELRKSSEKQEAALAALTTAVGAVHGVDADRLLADVQSVIKEEIDLTVVNLSVRVAGQEPAA